MNESNPLYDGTLEVLIGGINVTAAMLGGLGYSNTNPGGFGETTIRLPASAPWGTYNAAVVKGAAVTIKHGATPVTLFEGEVTSDVGHATIAGGTGYYDVTCAGLWWKAGQRGDFCAVFGDDVYDQWFTLGTNAQSFQVDTDGKLEIRLEKGQHAQANKGASLYYWLSDGMGDPAVLLSTLLSTIAIDVSGANWHAKLSESSSPWGTWTLAQEWTNTTVAPGAANWEVGLTSQALRLELYSTADVTEAAPITADRFITLRQVAVVPYLAWTTITGISKASPAVVTTQAAHGLRAADRIFIFGTDSVAKIDGWRTVGTVLSPTTFNLTGVNVLTTAGTGGHIVTAYRVDEAMAVAAGADGLAASWEDQAGGIGNANWGLNVRPHMSRADAIDMLAMTHAAPIDYGFWEGATFKCKERVAPPAANDYLIDSTLPGIDFDVKAATEDSPTHVKVLYKFRDVNGGTSPYPDGTVLAVYRPSAPTWGDASVVLDVWDEWADLSLETQQANAIGDQILAWLAANVYQGPITLATATVPKRAGGTNLAAYIRSGDYIEDANLATGRLMITSFSMDVDQGVATLGIGENRRDFVARITPRAKKKKGKK